MDKMARISDINELINKLDISPTMYKNAVEKYKAIGEYLQDEGLDCDIFPQGSFSLGTVIRPYKNSGEGSYDLDFICELKMDKEETTPKEVKYSVYDKLICSERYKKLLDEEEHDKCWSLNYATVDNVEFNMDIVPAVPENPKITQALSNGGLDSEYARKLISITNKKDDFYSWSISNPKAYKSWFDNINRPFFDFNKNERLNKILLENRSIFATIQDIPDGVDKSSLQRVIQLLKRHRDVYFSKLKKEDDKPISAIITTLAAQVAKDASPTLEIYDLLSYVVQGIDIYCNKNVMNEELFFSKYGDRNVIEFKNGKWKIVNPVNPEDNLADSWNQNPEKVRLFFKWVKQVKNDFIDSIEGAEEVFIVALENGLGSNYVQKSINFENYKPKTSTPIKNTPKPWRA